MKYASLTLATLCVLLFSGFLPIGIGDTQKIPSVNVKNLKGQTTSTSTFVNDGKPMIISFWATWCKPCIQELNTIQDLYPEWQKETGVKLIAISIDDARNSPKVAPFVKGRAWDYDVFIDENSDFKRAMNVNTVPHTFLVNGQGEVVWQHNSYAPGDEEQLYALVKKVARGEAVQE
jgi:cytochrome c biogenesis protein CcmG/thiol:disulfide interchange protein DsbE